MKIDYRELKQRIRLKHLLDRIGWENTEGRGDQLRGPCPLPACSSNASAGRNGSSGEHRAFSVHDSKNVYRCFRCGAAGNALDFWQAYRNTTLHAAATDLQQFLSTRNLTAISSQPANPQPNSSHPAKLADS